MTCEAPSSSHFSASCLQLLVLTSVLDAEYGLDVNGTRRGTEYMLTNILESPYSLKMFRYEYENERKQSSVVSRKNCFFSRDGKVLTLISFSPCSDHLRSAGKSAKISLMLSTLMFCLPASVFSSETSGAGLLLRLQLFDRVGWTDWFSDSVNVPWFAFVSENDSFTVT